MTLVNVPNFQKRSANRLFDGFFGNGFLHPMFQDRITNGTVPAVNVAETATGFRIEVAAPGLEKGDFKLSLEKDVLTIKVEKAQSEEETQDKFVRREFNYTTFERSFQLPKTIDQEKIDAKYESGVLHLSLPKREEALEKPSREISIN